MNDIVSQTTLVNQYRKVFMKKTKAELRIFYLSECKRNGLIPKFINIRIKLKNAVTDKNGTGIRERWV